MVTNDIRPYLTLLSQALGWLVRVCVFCVVLCVMVAGLNLALARGPQNWIPVVRSQVSAWIIRSDERRDPAESRTETCKNITKQFKL